MCVCVCVCVCVRGITNKEINRKKNHIVHCVLTVWILPYNSMEKTKQKKKIFK